MSESQEEFEQQYVTLERACAALAVLVREEYPDKPLAEIARIWGSGITPEQIEALELLESDKRYAD
jgi:hypothetical protein